MADRPLPQAVSEPRSFRWGAIALVLCFLALFLFVPLVAVFAEAFRRGVPVFLAAISEPEALAAIRLTLLVAVIAVPLNQFSE